ncbi:hypothetical protein IDJ77_09610 [Mucilaginibacter sp. ZT4R22]|uniref:Uncharacterized protein n=1 Tax=Mucilaginibacter pankratovii TaxID=2772110 RepID=A0ABR7WP04_9SPHI|nr:hypothetical protein [Mucilaginibacter pankratovii]MBD1364063.1 hypothetical protein [Mucilaginibacter pankratovii]
MKSFAILGLLLLLLTTGMQGYAQNFDVPKNYVLKTRDDYAKYEPDIIKTADWLQQTPWKAQPQKTEEANQFLLKWAKGTPAVTIRLVEAVMNLSDRNPQLGFVFMAAFSKYVLEHKEDRDPNNANIVAVRAVVKKYSAEPAHKPDEDIDHLIVLDTKGELNDWVISTFSMEER